MRLSVFSILFIALSVVTEAQTTSDPWKASQLMAPADLAKKVSGDRPTDILIYNIGTASSVKYAIKLEAASEAKGLEVFKNALANVSRDKKIVIFCGCCKLEHCPNIRPAFKALLDMGFKSPYVLNLPNDLSEDWIEKGYPYEL